MWSSWTGGSSSSTYFEKARWTTSYSSTLAHGSDTSRFGWWIGSGCCAWCVDATTTASEELRTEGLGVFLLVDVCFFEYCTPYLLMFFLNPSPQVAKGFVPLKMGKRAVWNLFYREHETRKNHTHLGVRYDSKTNSEVGFMDIGCWGFRFFCFFLTWWWFQPMIMDIQAGPASFKSMLGKFVALKQISACLG